MAGSGLRLTRSLCGLPSITLFGQPIACKLARCRSLIPATGVAIQHTSRRSHVTYDQSLRPIATQLASASEAKIQLNPPRIVLSREMEMEDTQMFGLVHGCMQLQLVEDAGTTLTTKYCNQFAQTNKTPVKTMSACLERADFFKPMFVGDIAEVEAEITYTTARSLQVTASVYAKNKDDGSRYKTIEAKTWYVPKTLSDEPATLPVPPLTDANGAPVVRPESEAGYQSIKEHRMRIQPELYDRPYRPYIVDYYAPAECIERFTVDYSRTTFALPIHPNHGVPNETYCRGGVILRLMDETGAFTACVHNNHYSFTANMEAVLFHRPVALGTSLTTHGKIIFTSSKTMEIAIRVDQHRIVDGVGPYTARVADGILTFIMVDKDTGKTLPVTPLKLVDDEEKEIFAMRKKLYEERKMAKKAAKS